ncbi:MAG: ribose 5-phosphate isomerase A [Deltaproteobacteria bacterium]|nr:ribose 5-phosphate isomerase A [Deltaproteobacteria bacterium]
MKELVAKVIAARVKDGDTIGIGSGRTAEAAIAAIGVRVKQERLNIRAFSTSPHSTRLARSLGINVLAPTGNESMQFAFDGADEIDPQFNLIKGVGGALLAEKVVARRAGGIVVLATADKLVSRLGERFPVPIEVIPEAVDDVEAQLRALGATRVFLRAASYQYATLQLTALSPGEAPLIASDKLVPAVTEHGNLLLDAIFPVVDPALADRLKLVTGVVETGIFVGLTREVIFVRDGVVWSRLPDGSGDRKIS